MNVSLLIHAANVLFLVAYLVRDILKLRFMALAAGLFLLGFHLLLQPPAWDFVAWDLLFAVIQIVQIRRLYVERKPVTLSEDERAVHRLAFRSLLPREVKRLCASADIGDAGEGEPIVKSGEEPDHLVLILRGEVDVIVGDARVAKLGEGQFVGEMSFLTKSRATADAVAGAATRLVKFRRAELMGMMEKTPEMKAQIQSVLGQDLVAKLKVRAAAAQGS
jgi:hypothetical protein